MKSGVIIKSWLLGVSILILAVSCATQPQPEAETPSATEQQVTTETEKPNPPSEEDLAALSSAVSREENARKLVQDFGGPGYFPADWNAAEALYNAAKQEEKKSTPEEAKASTERYSAAAAAYQALADKTMPRYAQDREAEITAARDAALASGIRLYGPDYLQAADSKTADALSRYNAKDYYAARDEALQALDMYRALKPGVEAYRQRLALGNAGAASYLPEYLQKADNKGIEALNNYNGGNYQGALGSAQTCLEMYQALAAGLLACKEREDLVAEGIPPEGASYLQQADDEALRGFNRFDAGNYQDARASAVQCLMMYAALETGLAAYQERETLIALGIKDYGPEYLQKADDVGQAALDSYEDGAFADAEDYAGDALFMYMTIDTILDAYKTRIAIEDRGLYEYDAYNIDIGDDLGFAALLAYAGGDIEDSAEMAEEARERYTVALITGLSSFAADMGAEAGTERQYALDFKANVAVRKDFENASSVYTRAAAAYRAGNWDEAAGLYIVAADLFASAWQQAEVKRATAEAALQQAELKMIESDGAAAQAELILEGGY